MYVLRCGLRVCLYFCLGFSLSLLFVVFCLRGCRLRLPLALPRPASTALPLRNRQPMTPTSTATHCDATEQKQQQQRNEGQASRRLVARWVEKGGTVAGCRLGPDRETDRAKGAACGGLGCFAERWDRSKSSGSRKKRRERIEISIGQRQ